MHSNSSLVPWDPFEAHYCSWCSEPTNLPQDLPYCRTRAGDHTGPVHVDSVVYQPRRVAAILPSLREISEHT